MGYTHYWEMTTGQAEYEEAWPAIVAGAREIVNAARESGIAIAGPMGTGEPEFDLEDGIALNGDAGRDEDYETFELLPEVKWAFCKTGLRPYDLVVAAILRNTHALVPAFEISSDGGDEAWVEADELLASMPRLKILP